MVVLGRDGSIQGFAPQALGERVPQITNGYFYADTGISLLGHFQEYAKLYRSQPVVATLVDKIANSGARLDLKVYDISDPKGRKEQPDTDFAKLLRAPSRTMSAFSFYRWTFSTYEVLGEAYWLKVRDNTGKVVTLEPMHPERVSIKRDINGIVTYIFSIGVASAGILEVPADDVVAFQRYNPDNVMRGLSRLEQLRVTLYNEDAARRANSAFWKNGARPSVVLTHPDSLSRDAMDKIGSQFTARHSGADNFGGAVVLEEGMTIVETQLDSEEMQYIESRKLNMQEVCMVFDVPPPVVHILDHATYSNITEQMRSMYRDTMAPRFEDFESVIDFALRTEFYPDGGFEAEFDMTDILRGDFETRATTAAALRQGGIVTGNEARDIIGLEQSADPEMAKVFANSAMVELGTKPPAPGGGDAGGSPDDHRVPGDELLDGGPKPPKPGSVPGDELLKPKPVLGKPTPATKALERAVLGEAGRVIKSGGSRADLRQMLVEQHVKALEPYFAEQRHAAERGEFGPKAPARKGLLRASTKDDSGEDDPYGDDPFDEGNDYDDLPQETYGWDDKLAAILGTLSTAAASAIGKMVNAQLSSADVYDPSAISDLLKVEAGHSARHINKATYQRIADELAIALQDSSEDEIDEEDDSEDEATPYGTAVAASYAGLTGDNPYRLKSMSESRVHQVELTAGIDAAEQNGVVTKTWRVNSPKPRPSHAAVDGESVGLGELFSNGMLGPGDIANGGIDEVAGCDCTVDYGYEDAKSYSLKYSPDQERDDHGRFGGGSASSLAAQAATEYGPKEAPGKERQVAYKATSRYTGRDGRKYSIHVRHTDFVNGVGTHKVRGFVTATADGEPSTVDGRPNLAGQLQYTNQDSDSIQDVQPGTYGIEHVSVAGEHEGNGLATAMLETARHYSDQPVVHSTTLTDDGTGWSQHVKSIGLKYSDDEDRDDHGRWTSGGGGDSAPADESPSAAAARVNAAAVAAEPKITATMKSLSEKHGGKLVGLEYAVKTPSSLERKITADAAAEGISVTEAANAVSDANRYTMELSPDNYTDGAEATLKDLADQGYSERVKNFWPDGDPYQGINAALKTPEGQNVELQFHTADSFQVKEAINHPLYESFRTSTDQGERRSLWDKMVANARTIPVPRSVLSIPTLRVQKL